MEAPENSVTIVDTQEGAAKLIVESSLTLSEAFIDTLKHQVECEYDTPAAVACAERRDLNPPPRARRPFAQPRPRSCRRWTRRRTSSGASTAR